MTLGSDVRTSQLLDMSLDDVNKVLRRNKALPKEVGTTIRHREPEDDYGDMRNVQHEQRGGYRGPMHPFPDYRGNYRGPMHPFPHPRDDFRGLMHPFPEPRVDFHGPMYPFPEPRNDFRGPMHPFADPRIDFREPKGDHRDMRGNAFFGRPPFNMPEVPRRERFYPQSYGARPLHVTPYGPPMNEPRPPKFIVRVTNLDHTVTQDKLMRLFATVGEVDRVWIDYDHNARSRGTGGCIFKSMSDAKFAISKYNGMDLSGRPMSVYGEYQDNSRPRLRPQLANRTGHNPKAQW